jgi:hypothetical protein
MSNVRIQGNPAGSGTLTIAAPNTNSDVTLSLPAANGTIMTNSGNEAASFATLAVAGNNVSAQNSFGFRNRIINGDMRIDQRNNGAAVSISINSPTYVVDRWAGVGASTSGAFSLQRDNNVPSGFVNSLRATVTTADTSIPSNQGYALLQRLEGFNVSDLGWGTSSAQSVTLSFWVRSSLTGTFGGALRNGASNRSYPFTYTISSANTWERKTLTIEGDTTGTWLTDSGVGLNVFFGLGVGTDRSGTAGAWNANNNISATGATNLIATNGATFYITGVQLEAGLVATPFERRPYGTELALCQRYYYSIGATFYGNVSFHMFTNGQVPSTTLASAIQPFPVTMRTAPTFSATNPTNFRVGSAAGFFTVTAVALDVATPINANINYTSSGMTAGQGCGIVQSAGNLAALNFSAEL